MRSDEMTKDSAFTRHGVRRTSQEIVAAKHRRLTSHQIESFAPGLLEYYLYQIGQSSQTVSSFAAGLDHQISSTKVNIDQENINTNETQSKKNP